jgi:hypothetical protein
MARLRDRTPKNRRALYGFQDAARGSPRIFWEGICDVESCTITIREGEVGSEPEPTVMRFSSPQQTYDTYEDLLDELWHERDFRGADEAFLSLAPVEVNRELVDRIERAFSGVPRGRIGIREASAIDSRLAEVSKEYVTARAEDQETDWRDIPYEVLACDPGVFPHLDDQGFKFVLPAMMRWTIAIAFDGVVDRCSLSQWLFNALVRRDDVETLARRWALSPSQLAVVVEWLDEYLLSDPYPTSDEVERVERWRSLKMEALLR